MRLRERLRRKGQRILAFGLATVIVASNASMTVLASNSGGSGYYSATLGSKTALGSPLSNADFSSDDWNKWETLVFGMFIGNYCELGKEDYKTAFRSGGKGLEALQFNAGGDVNSNGILRKMLNICITSQQTNLSPISVRYRYWDTEDLTPLDLGTRNARFDDLLPVIVNGEIGKRSIDIAPSSQITAPLVESNAKKEWDAGGMKFQGADHENIILPSRAILPEFSITTNNKAERKQIFSLLDGYDASLMSTVLSKMDEDTIEELRGKELKFDAFGNICAMNGGKPVVIIPAAANKNINKNKEVNLLNSLIVNGLTVGNRETNLVANASEGYLEHSNKNKFIEFLNGDEELTSMMGMPAASSTGKVKPGKIILYADTDPLLMKDVYALIKSQASTDAEAVKRDVLESGVFPMIGGNASGSGDTGNTGETGGEGNEGESEPEEPDTGIEVDDESMTYPASESPVDYNISYLSSFFKTDAFNWGNYISKVLDKDSLYNAPFKMEATGINTESMDFINVGFSAWKVENTIKPADVKGVSQLALTQISDIFPFYLPKESLTSMLLINGGKNTSSTDLLSGSYYLSPASNSQKTGMSFHKDWANIAWKKIAKSADMRERLKKDTVVNSLDNIVMLMSSGDINEFISLESKNEGEYLDDMVLGSTLLDTFEARYNLKKQLSADDRSKMTLGKLHNDSWWHSAGALKSNMKGVYDSSKDFPSKDASDVRSLPMRVCKVYKPSGVFEAVSKIYDLDKSALFKEYTTGMYITYLDWNGILKYKTDDSLRFDTSLFEGRDFLNIDPDDLLDSMTDEDKDKTIRNRMMQMLDPGEAGREFRKDVVGNLAADLFDTGYEQSAKGDGVGFLNVSGYKENVITSWVLDRFAQIQMIMYVALFGFMVLQGVFKRRGLAWFFGTLGSLVLTVVSIPGFVEITPLVCNRAIQEGFKENALYWLAIEDAENQKQAASSTSDGDSVFNGLTDQQTKEAVVLMNSIRLQQSDRTLLVKLDTSKKVIEQISIDWENLQRHASTRWLVPSIIQQLSADKDNYDYVYIPTYDWFNNMTRAYLAMLTNNSDDNGSGGTNIDYKGAYNILSSCFYTGEYFDPEVQGSASSLSSHNMLNEHDRCFKMYVDTSSANDVPADTYKSISRVNLADLGSTTHTRIYFLNSNGIEIPNIEKNGIAGIQKEEWDALADNANSFAGNQLSSLQAYNKTLLEQLNSYNRYDRGISPGFTNLWCTEGIGPYFYAVVKDTLPITNSSVDFIAHQLAGTVNRVELVDEDGNVVGEKAVRASMMHQGNTGYVRDFLDLEEAFTNMLPYLYETQILMGGNNGKNGVLGESLMGESYSIYKDNLQSWLYRSNWVTKIMSDSKYSGRCIVRKVNEDGSKTEVEIPTMCDPRSYPADRPMVFSEAQQKSLGLYDSDLNLLELKLVRVNNEVCEEWTKLINYSNIANINSETLERLMTVSAVNKFNSIISRNTFFDGTRALYPRNIDLRNVNWDTLMRHMVVSTSKNSNYLTTNHLMRNIIDTAGFFVGGVLLIVTWISANFIPAGRDLLLSMMLLFVVLSALLNLSHNWRKKLKANGGWAITYMLFTGFTVIFYRSLARIIGTGNVSDIVKGSMSAVSGASLSFKALLLLVLDLAYTAGIIYYMKKVVFRGGLSGFKSYIMDGGFGFFAETMGSVTDRINRGVKGVRNSVSAGMTNLFHINKSKTEINQPSDKPVPVKPDGGQVGTIPANSKATANMENRTEDATYIMEAINTESDASKKERKEQIANEIQKGMNMGANGSGKSS